MSPTCLAVGRSPGQCGDFDAETHGGTCSELFETTACGAVFDVLAASAGEWDGPVRRIG